MLVGLSFTERSPSGRHAVTWRPFCPRARAPASIPPHSNTQWGTPLAGTSCPWSWLTCGVSLGALCRPSGPMHTLSQGLGGCGHRCQLGWAQARARQGRPRRALRFWGGPSPLRRKPAAASPVPVSLLAASSHSFGDAWETWQAPMRCCACRSASASAAMHCSAAAGCARPRAERTAAHHHH